MEFMRSFEKMNSRYLWKEEEMLEEGNEELIWGFLDDLWHWANNKVSKTDPVSSPQGSPT